MSSGFVWTVVGSVAAVVAAAIAFLQWVLPAITERRHSRPVVSGGRWWPRSRPQVANPRPRRTPRFTGRGALLAELRQAVRTNRPVVLYGLGGVGKTQLALEHSEREQRRFDVVWWIHAEQRATVESDLVALARALRLPEHADPDQERVLAAVRDWLDQHHRWLLVLDNAENDEVLGWVLPSEPRGRVLVTSRNQLWRDAIVVWVRPWTPEESLAFLRVSLAPVPTARFDTAVAQALAAELGHLPIALEQAVAFVRAVARPLADYLTMLRARPQELLDLSDLPDDERTVGKTWAAALERVRATPGAAELLALCAFMAANDIPRDLVHNGAERLAGPLAMVAADQVALGSAVITLRRFSFVDATQQTLTVHRLVQAVVRHRLGDDGRRQWAASAVRLVDASFPKDSNDVRTWPVCEVLLPHALMVSGHAEQLGVEPNAAGRLLNHAGMYLLGRARLAESNTIFKRALAIAEVTLGPDHIDVAACRSNLGVVLRDLGDLTGARVQYERAAEIAEAAVGPDHPNVAVFRSNLGDVLQVLGDLAGARIQLERALAIDEAALGPDHPNVAVRRNNLGRVLHDLGDLAGARIQLERALAINEVALGPDHPRVATVRNSLGGILQVLGDLAGARTQYERALAIDEAALGPDHPEVAVRRNNLGRVLHDLGDLAGARIQLERALAINEVALGPDHLSVAVCRDNLGGVLHGLGDLAGARAQHERALVIAEATLGPDHPKVAISNSNLGDVLHALGDVAGARAHYERALAIDEAALGPDHPTVATDRDNLAALDRQQ